MKQSILITRKLEDNILQQLNDVFELDVWPETEVAMPRDELLKRVVGKDGILCMLTDQIDEELLNAAGDQFKTVSTMSVGFDHVDIKALKERGITLGYTPEVLSDSVADLTIALMLNAGRRIPEAARQVKNGGWGTWSPYWMTGHDLSGATVGIIGMGHIGEKVAKRLSGFDCKVLYHSRSRRSDLEQSLNIEQASLDTLLANSDFITVHAPLTPQTKDMCDSNMFHKMKSSAVFVNTSRGGLVNQEDLYIALSTGQIYAAGLDVTTPEPLPTDSPLLELENCLVLPHIGSASIRTRAKMGEIAAQNLQAGLGSGEFIYQVEL